MSNEKNTNLFVLVKKKIKIKHIDGISNVIARVIIRNGDVEFEYNFQGMVYGQTLSMDQCIKLGYIKLNEI